MLFFLKRSAKFIGFCGFNKVTYEETFTPCIEINWRILPSFWHQGLATEASLAALKFAKDNLRLQEIYSITATVNTPSQKLMKRIGMRFQKKF
ncbi:hypothetical protein MFLO_03300 [Listeria floridensis FSL S10-1187]|uniref:N-acetyltransferase domain-containing protein n=2 Tax=Listeria floridensis TaxID=1494962 RepID=A0ABP3B0D5_9LIST|nr:hypothetical protein MFLO_03300 [Listeria floridensis FSL S10-1187]